MGNAYFKSNLRFRYDYLIGCRGWGLVLYGTLPASLAVLRVIKIPEFEIRAFEIVGLLVFIAFIPLLVLYLLIRQRLMAWYLMVYGLRIRSIFITLAILILSSVICGAAGLIEGKYILLTPKQWLLVDSSLRWRPIVEAFLLGIVILVGSSTLFLAAVRETGGLPALPSADFIKNISDLKDALTSIQNDLIWIKLENTELDKFSNNLERALNLSKSISHKFPQFSGRNIFYNMIADDLAKLLKALSQIKKSQLKWDVFFQNTNQIGLNKEDIEIRSSVVRIGELRINA
jgi:hypothetical protein